MPGKRGDHDVKFGASYYYLPLHVFDAGTLNGQFGFSASDRDFNAADPRTYPDRLTIRVPGVSDYFVKGKEIGLFAQDKWKVNGRFTASLGLRWDVEDVQLDNTGNFLFSDPRIALAGRQEQPVPTPRRHVDARRSRDGGHSRRLRPLFPEDVVLELHADRLVGRDVQFVHRVVPDQQHGPWSVDGTAADRAVPRQRAGRESRAAESRSIRPVRRRRTPARSGSTARSTPAVLAPGEHRDREAGGGEHRGQRRLRSRQPSRSLHAAGAESWNPCHDGPDGRGRADLPDHAVQRRYGARQRGNAGTFEYNALQTSIQKRYSNHYQVRLSYTYSRGRAPRGRPAPPIRSRPTRLIRSRR